jgi:hypothetical protein
MLEVRGLRCRYGKTSASTGIRLKVREDSRAGVRHA